jgi:hypothetical protein
MVLNVSLGMKVDSSKGCRRASLRDLLPVPPPYVRLAKALSVASTGKSSSRGDASAGSITTLSSNKLSAMLTLRPVFDLLAELVDPLVPGRDL